MLQVPYGGLDRDRPLIRLPFTSFAVGTVLLPLTGLVACLFISLMYNFEDATYTHCRVSNYLPSISAAISRVPERYIWRCCIGLHSAPRYLVSVAYFSFYRGRFARRLPELLLSGLALLCSLAENSGLLLLTYVSSTETYNVHKNGFVVFIGSSLLHMLITCWLWHVIRRSYVNPEVNKPVSLLAVMRFHLQRALQGHTSSITARFGFTLLDETLSEKQGDTEGVHEWSLKGSQEAAGHSRGLTLTLMIPDMSAQVQGKTVLFFCFAKMRVRVKGFRREEMVLGWGDLRSA
uniref:Acyltransferase PGAP2 n=1 Tax=Lates calcarifer TaxID=8187 RepID=A0A4W6DJX8_LATCA